MKLRLNDENSDQILSRLWWIIGVDLSEDDFILGMSIAEVINEYTEDIPARVALHLFNCNSDRHIDKLSEMRFVEDTEYVEKAFSIDEVMRMDNGI